MMSTYNFDQSLYSPRWTSSDWYQFLLENTVLFGRFKSIWINILFKISSFYPKSEENVDFTLRYVLQILYRYNSLTKNVYFYALKI